MILNEYIGGLDFGFQVALFRQRQVLEHRSVGVASDEGGDASFVVVSPFVEALFGRAGWALNAQVWPVGNAARGSIGCDEELISQVCNSACAPHWR